MYENEGRPQPPLGAQGTTPQPTVPQPTVQQPTTYAPTPSSPAAGPRKNRHAFLKTFGPGFLGALLACLLVLGLTGNLFRGAAAGSSTVLGADSGTSINASDDSATLAEAVSEKVLPSVVCIYVYTQTQSSFFGQQSSSSEELSSLGSGVILSKDGYILTNYHVIEGAKDLKVSYDGESLAATVVGSDPTSDLAVIKVDRTDLTPVDIGSSSDLRTGEWVMAVGAPYGMEQSVSTGIVSATSRSSSSLQSSESTAVYANMIQTDAAINPGNSGGALVDADGKLIGINTIIASNSQSSSGVGFAIPVDYAINISQQIIDGKTPTHAQLGVSLSTVNSSNAARNNLPTDKGAYVSSVYSGGGAVAAGIQVGDIITKVDGTTVSSATDVILEVREQSPGDTISVEFNRNGETHTVDVTLGSDSSSVSTSSYSTQSGIGSLFGN